MSPVDALPPTEAQVLVALLRIEHGGGRPTIRTIVDEIGGLSTNTVHRWLRSLRDRGLVAFEDGHSGTLRSSTVVLPIGVR